MLCGYVQYIRYGRLCTRFAAHTCEFITHRAVLPIWPQLSKPGGQVAEKAFRLFGSCGQCHPGMFPSGRIHHVQGRFQKRSAMLISFRIWNGTYTFGRTSLAQNVLHTSPGRVCIRRIRAAEECVCGVWVCMCVCGFNVVAAADRSVSSEAHALTQIAHARVCSMCVRFELSAKSPCLCSYYRCGRADFVCPSVPSRPSVHACHKGVVCCPALVAIGQRPAHIITAYALCKQTTCTEHENGERRRRRRRCRQSDAAMPSKRAPALSPSD